MRVKLSWEVESCSLALDNFEQDFGQEFELLWLLVLIPLFTHWTICLFLPQTLTEHPLQARRGL